MATHGNLVRGALALRLAVATLAGCGSTGSQEERPAKAVPPGGRFAALAALTVMALAATTGVGHAADGFAPNESWTSNPYYGSRGTYFADVTGDRRADAIVVNNDKVTVRRSRGGKFQPNESWTSNPYYGSRGTYFADVTGDGRADAIVVNDDKVTVRRSTGGAFAPNKSWTSNLYKSDRGD
jgi:hypothetical protein